MQLNRAIPTKSDAHSAIKEILEQMREAINNPAKFEGLSDQLCVLTQAYMLPTLPENPYDLTESESRIFNLLAAKFGRMVDYTAIRDALYYDDPQCGPDSGKIMQVFVCKMRTKLKKSPYCVDTIWGVGYRLRLSLMPSDSDALPAEFVRRKRARGKP